MIYGGAVVLSGKLPVAKAGEKVTLRAEVLTRTGTKQTSSVAEVRSTASGAFTFTTAPTARTTYTVGWQATPAARDGLEPRHGHRGAADRDRHRQEGRPVRHLLDEGDLGGPVCRQVRVHPAA